MADAPLGTVVRHLRKLVVAQAVQGLTDRELLLRFVADREEAAFAALVQRHAALVWGVCRNVLRHDQDADDALQATFVVLARRAASIRKAEALASWLHGVAWRTAQLARRSAAIRRAHERRGATMPRATGQAEMDVRELQAILDEEVQRLPEKYRAPFVLCCLEGRTRAEAARELGCREGTVWSRLAKARQRLRQRLTRRGVALSAVLCLSALAAEAGEAAVPAALLGAAVRAGLLGAAGRGAVSAPVADLVEAVTRTLPAGKGKVATALLLAAGVVLAGVAALGHPALAQRPGQGTPTTEPSQAAGPAEPPRAEPRRDEESGFLLAGRVEDADGRPVAGGPVALLAAPFYGTDGRPVEHRLLALTQADEHGRFRIAMPAPVQDFASLVVLAGGKGHGTRWQPLDDPYRLRQEVAVKLSRKPARRVISGRVVNVQGLPVPGVDVSLGTGYPAAFVERLGDWPQPVLTDDQGRFRLPGVSRDTVETVVFEHERYAGHDEEAPASAEEVSCTLTPARVIEGRVLYGDTGKPVANAVLGSTSAPMNAAELGRVCVDRPEGPVTTFECVPVRSTGVRTDAQGRFRLVNYADFMAFPPTGEPYLAPHQRVDWPSAVVRREVEVRLERGVLVQGSVRVAGSGRPVARAQLGYIQSGRNNPLYRRDYTDSADFAVEGSALRHRSAADGSFQFVIPPGKGYLLARGPSADYLHVETTLWALGQALMNPAYRRYPDAVVALDTNPGAGPQELTVELRRGITVRGRLLGPDDRPIHKARLVCRWYLPVEYHLFYQHGLEVRDGRFELPGCDPKIPRPAYVYDEESSSGATVPLGGAEMAGGPVTIRLQPCGSARMRFLDGNGRPLAGYRPYLELVLPLLDPARKQPVPSNEHLALLNNRLEGFLPWGKHYAQGGLATEATNARGEITLPDLIPGASYRISSQHGWTFTVTTFTAEAGKTLDLGDLTDKPPG
jgi:RNA polymerase sigma factor (sigma-70 family)